MSKKSQVDYMPEKDPFISLHVDKTLDLRGKVCPMTFVYTKVALEKMEPGQILHIILDYTPAFANVPNSVVKQQLGEIMMQKGTDQIRDFYIKRI